MKQTQQFAWACVSLLGIVATLVILWMALDAETGLSFAKFCLGVLLLGKLTELAIRELD
jgi:hypothetical protein